MLTKQQITPEYISNTKWDMRPVTDETGKEWSTEELHQKLQPILFELGRRWNYGDGSVLHTSDNYLYVNIGPLLGSNCDPYFFENYSFTQRNPLEVIKAWYAEPVKQEEEPLIPMTPEQYAKRFEGHKQYMHVAKEAFKAGLNQGLEKNPNLKELNELKEYKHRMEKALYNPEELADEELADLIAGL